MLTVYTYPETRPRGTIDLSTIPLSELAGHVQDIVHHQRNVQLWFGYLDGWMLTPQEDVLLRKAIRKFECFVVSSFPLAFSQSWKNEIRFIYTARPHGATNSNDNGGIVHNGHEIGYGSVGS